MSTIRSLTKRTLVLVIHHVRMADVALAHNNGIFHDGGLVVISAPLPRPGFYCFLVNDPGLVPGQRFLSVLFLDLMCHVHVVIIHPSMVMLVRVFARSSSSVRSIVLLISLSPTFPDRSRARYQCQHGSRLRRLLLHQRGIIIPFLSTQISSIGSFGSSNDRQQPKSLLRRVATPRRSL